MNQVEVLRDHLSPGTGEVQGKGLFGASEIVEFEDELLGQVRLITPDDPSEASVDEPKLMTAGVDGLHSR